MWLVLITYTELKKKSQIFLEVVVPPKQEKKGPINMSPESHTIWDNVHLFIVADDVWLWVHLRDRQGKHRGNKYCMVTVVAEGYITTLSTSYNKCYEWKSGWTSPMNKCTGCRMYAFPDPSVIFFFKYYDMYYHLSQYWSLLFLAAMINCTEHRKYAFLNPCLIVFRFHVVICTTTSHNIGHFCF